MEAYLPDSTATAPSSPQTNKDTWESNKKSIAMTSFSLGVAYAWICSVIASVLSLGAFRPASKTEHNNKVSKKTSRVGGNTLSPLNQKLPSPSLPLKRKTLILDLDETLVHSTVKPVPNHDLTVDVMIDGVSCTFYVIKRPHVDNFLKKVCEWFDVIIFTASMQQYADPLIDQLDSQRILRGRLFRESCLVKDGNFIKDLSLIGQDLATTIIIDNSPIAYSHNKENAMPIDNWMGDNPADDALLNLLPFLNALRFTSDVRSILSLRAP
jgi:Dullard-like phosphatase family protein